jgi:hypothetical protein
MDVCVHLFCVALCGGRGCATGSSPVQGGLSTVYRVKKVRSEVKVQQKGFGVINNNNNNNNKLNSMV